MQALKQTPNRSPLTKRIRPVKPILSHKRRYTHRIVLIEVLAKLAVNMGFILFTATSLIKLVALKIVVEKNLQDLQITLTATEERVHRVESSFNQTFDPQQTSLLRQNLSNKIDPLQKEVVLEEPLPSSFAEPVP